MLRDENLLVSSLTPFLDKHWPTKFDSHWLDAGNDDEIKKMTMDRRWRIKIDDMAKFSVGMT
jgi:hypothetical protein